MLAFVQAADASGKKQAPNLVFCLMCSLADNYLKAEGAKHVRDMLTANTTLKELKCAAC